MEGEILTREVLKRKGTKGWGSWGRLLALEAQSQVPSLAACEPCAPKELTESLPHAQSLEPLSLAHALFEP